VFNEAKDDVLERYTIVKGDMGLLDSDIRKHFIGIRETAVGFEALSDHKAEAEQLFGRLALIQRPTLEDLIYFTAKGGRKYA
jgi:ABC-2 type transport system ATP-binding protein